MPKLITLRGPTRGREYDVQDVCIFGRSPNCQIYIGDLTVSRQHAQLLQKKDGWFVEDLGSGNGTYVNDERISCYRLRNNDEIRISDCLFRFLADREPSSKWIDMMTVVDNGEMYLEETNTDHGSIRLAVDQENLSADELRAGLTKAHRMLETLYAVSNATSSTLDAKQLFNQLLEYLFNIFPEADQGFIMLLDDHQQLIPEAVRRRKISGYNGGLTVPQSVISKVITEGKSTLSTSSAPGTKNTISRMCAPIMAQGKTLGVLLIEGKENSQPFDSEDRDLLSGIAMQASVAILNARMHRRLMAQQRIEQDLLVARQIQQSFLPAEPPEVKGFHFSRYYDPAFEVGGDFYDFIPLPGQSLGILIGDVSGKGMSAALLMARLTSDIRYYAISEFSPARVLSKANKALMRATKENDDRFATVLYLVLDIPHRTITLSNAGHLPPLLRLAHDGSVVELDDATNLALGVIASPTFEEYSIVLEPGDGVFLYTDGVIEAQNGQKEVYGLQRLTRIIGASPVENLIESVLRDLQRHGGTTTAQYDDIALVSFACY